MRTILVAMGLIAAVGLMCCHSAEAVPAAASTIKGAAIAASPLQQAQYREYRTRHYFVKCYRTLVFGPYHCHYFRRM